MVCRPFLPSSLICLPCSSKRRDFKGKIPNNGKKIILGNNDTWSNIHYFIWRAFNKISWNALLAPNEIIPCFIASYLSHLVWNLAKKIQN
tara:strand:+ start:1490 stop:1759 length:270 start_codon:yes stop_codon:yes gene_type:complete